MGICEEEDAVIDTDTGGSTMSSSCSAASRTLRKDEIEAKFAPFVRRSPQWTVSQRIITAFMTVFVFPIRLIILGIGLSLLWIIAALGMAGVQDLDKYQFSPLPSWRKCILSSISPLTRALLFLSLGVFKIERSEFDAELQDIVPSSNATDSTTNSKPHIIVSNHLGYLDIAVLLATYRASFVAKSNIAQLAFVGRVAKAMQCIFVSEPSNGFSEQIRRRLEAASSAHSPENGSSDTSCSGCQACLNTLVVFPEGTTCNGTAMIRFRSGAFVAGYPVLPVAIRFKNPNFNLSWESILFKEHLWRSMTQFSNAVELIELPLYNPSELEKENPLLYAKNVQDALEKCLEIPVFDLNRKHKVIYHSYLMRKINAETALAQAQVVSEQDETLKRYATLQLH